MKQTNNPFPYADDNKRYHTYNYYLRHRFGGKVFKVPLDAGFTCPNIDGTKGVGGCTYCFGGSSAFPGRALPSIPEQMAAAAAKLEKKWGKAPMIPYFQAYTNTYAPLEVLREKYEQALAQENVVGLSIATRADAVSEETADYLGQLSRRTYLVVELGLQTVHDETGRRINRCHSYEDFLRGYELLRSRGVLVCVHIINGLPGETHAMMVETARRLSGLDLHCLKIHLLHVMRSTPIAGELERGLFSLMSREEYVRTVCDQLELLPPRFILQRLTGDGERENLIGPLWSLKKFCVLNEIDKELVRRDTFQGAKYSGRFWEGTPSPQQ